MNQDNDFINLIDSIKEEVKELTVSEVKDRINSNEKFFLFDIREDHEVVHGTIANAIHLSKGVIERDINKFVSDKESQIILYCSGGYRSILAAYIIQKMGYKNVYSMAGGLKCWVNEN